MLPPVDLPNDLDGRRGRQSSRDALEQGKVVDSSDVVERRSAGIAEASNEVPLQREEQALATTFLGPLLPALLETLLPTRL